MQILFRADVTISTSVGLLSRFWREEDGASAAEYALLLAIIVTGVAIATGTLGTSLSNAMNNASDCVGESGNCSL